MDNDLISRSALLEWLCEGCNGFKKIGCDTPCYAYDLINEAPAVDAEPVRHGRWVESDIRYAVTDLLEGEYPESLTCSRCGFKHKFADEYGYSCIWHYCPNCGAKMDGDSP